jgi:hypothetical protein
LNIPSPWSCLCGLPDSYPVASMDVHGIEWETTPLFKWKFGRHEGQHTIGRETLSRGFRSQIYLVIITY